MLPLYNDISLDKLQQQIRRRSLVFLLILTAGLALIIITLILDDHRENRPQVWTVLAVIVTGSALIFFDDLMIRPLRAYRRHLDSSLHGRNHEITVIFDHVNHDSSVVDGVVYRDLIFLGEADRHGDRERLFYWDQEVPLPSFAKGQEVTLRYYDRFITGYQI